MPSHFWKIGDVEVEYDTPDETEIQRDAHEVVGGVAEHIKQESTARPQPYRPNLDAGDCYCGDAICTPSRTVLTRSKPVGVSSFDAGAGVIALIGVPSACVAFLVYSATGSQIFGVVAFVGQLGAARWVVGKMLNL